MTFKFSVDELTSLVSKQLTQFFLFDYCAEAEDLKKSICFSLEKCKYNFDHNKGKYLHGGGVNPFHSVQNMIFLYYASAYIYKNLKNESLASKVYYLNKMLNAVDLFYAIELPDIFFAEHPLAAVMGRAKYADNFFFYQNTTVGGNKKMYPTIGKNVILYANATVLGNSIIGNNCLISACSYIKDEKIPDYTIVYGKSPNLVLKHRRDIIDEAIQSIFIV